MTTAADFENDIGSCLRALQSGGLILYPTDTIWGIGSDATNPDAVRKVDALKQRAESKSLIVLMADQRDILQYTSQPDLRVFDFLATLHKPTTIIYEGAIGLADNLVNADQIVAADRPRSQPLPPQPPNSTFPLSRAPSLKSTQTGNFP